MIEGVKADRGKEGFLHKECAGFFYDIMSKATKVNMKDASDFKMMDRKAVDSILSMPERNMFFRATSSWVGYKTTSVEFEVHKRIDHKYQRTDKTYRSCDRNKLQRKSSKCHYICERIFHQRPRRPLGNAGLSLLHLKFHTGSLISHPGRSKAQTEIYYFKSN